MSEPARLTDAEKLKLIDDLLEETKEECPVCKGQKTQRAVDYNQDPPDAWIEDCSTCQGTGYIYHPERIVVVKQEEMGGFWVIPNRVGLKEGD